MSSPLADRLRPEQLNDMVGQRHLLGENMPLRNIVSSGTLPHMIFLGPSGAGKTTTGLSVLGLIPSPKAERYKRVHCGH